MKLTLKEVARWKGSGFDPHASPGDLQKLLNQYSIEELYLHFDSGVPRASRGFSRDPKQRYAQLGRGDDTVPQKSFNPQTRFETPVGIYVYPLDWARSVGFNDLSDVQSYKNIPFATEHKYVYIYHIPKKDTTTIQFFASPDFFAHIIEDMQEGYGRRESKLDVLKASECQALLKISPERFVEIADAYGNDYRGAAQEILSSTRGISSDARLARFTFYFTNNYMDKNINQWTKYLLDYNVRFFRDDGGGIIHPNEPYQGVILDPRVAKLVYVRDNPNAPEKIKASNARQQAAANYKVIASNPKIGKQIFTVKVPSEVLPLLINPNLNMEGIMTLYRRNLYNWGIREADALTKNPNFDIAPFRQDIDQFIAVSQKQKGGEALSLPENNFLYKFFYFITGLIGNEQIESSVAKKILEMVDTLPAWERYLSRPDTDPDISDKFYSKLGGIISKSGLYGNLTNILSILKNPKIKKDLETYRVLVTAIAGTGETDSTSAGALFRTLFKSAKFGDQEFAKAQDIIKDMLSGGLIDQSAYNALTKYIYLADNDAKMNKSAPISEQLYRYSKRLGIFIK